MRFAYADPPYLGFARYYDHPDAERWNGIEAHRELIEALGRDFPDGWALSSHSPSLRKILPLCPADCRVAAWVKPFCSFKPGVNPAYAWEPVIFRGGRKHRTKETVRDWCSVNVALRRGLVGAKPANFCFWVFRLLGAGPEDEFIDLFPGTGAVGVAWQQWLAQAPLPMVIR